jgi:hypothetical protein
MWWEKIWKNLYIAFSKEQTAVDSTQLYCPLNNKISRSYTITNPKQQEVCTDLFQMID